MSSSDPGRRFLLTALAATAGLTLAAFAATALLDPFGMIAATTPLHGPCAPGIKVMDETAVAPPSPPFTSPRTSWPAPRGRCRASTPPAPPCSAAGPSTWA